MKLNNFESIAFTDVEVDIPLLDAVHMFVYIEFKYFKI